MAHGAQRAYVVVPVAEHGKFRIGACVRGENGYHPVDDYGPYEDEKKAQGVVDRLNERLGVSRKAAMGVVRSTMIAAVLGDVKGRRLGPRQVDGRGVPVTRPHRKHSKEGSIHCDLCAPLRCCKAP